MTFDFKCGCSGFRERQATSEPSSSGDRPRRSTLLDRMALHVVRKLIPQSNVMVRMSESVQVFGRRNAKIIHALWRPASENRQGTKSRGVGHRRSTPPYGDLPPPPVSRPL